jgi:hypothetical protein
MNKVIPFNKPSSAGKTGSAQYSNMLSGNEYMLMSDLRAQPAYPLDPNALNPRNFMKPVNSPVPVPTPAPNGGLYSGPQATGPWANIPIQPEMHIYIANLSSAEPPPGAQNQMVGTNRLGNNTLMQPPVRFFVPKGATTEADNPYAIYVSN